MTAPVSDAWQFASSNAVAVSRLMAKIQTRRQAHGDQAERLAVSPVTQVQSTQAAVPIGQDAISPAASPVTRRLRQQCQQLQQRCAELEDKIWHARSSRNEVAVSSQIDYEIGRMAQRSRRIRAQLAQAAMSRSPGVGQERACEQLQAECAALIAARDGAARAAQRLVAEVLASTARIARPEASPGCDNEAVTSSSGKSQAHRAYFAQLSTEIARLQTERRQLVQSMRALQTEFDSAGDRPIRRQVLTSVAYQIQKATPPQRDNAELLNLRAGFRFLDEGHGHLLQRVLTERSVVAVQDLGAKSIVPASQIMLRDSVSTSTLTALQTELHVAADEMLQACSTVTAAASAWDGRVRTGRKHASGCVAQAVVHSLSRTCSTGGSVTALRNTVKSLHDSQARLAEWLRRADKASEAGQPCMDRLSWKQSMVSAGGGVAALRQCCAALAAELAQFLPQIPVLTHSPILFQQTPSIATIDKESNAAARAMQAASSDTQADIAAMMSTAQQLEQESVFLQMRSATLESQLGEAAAELAAAGERNRLLQQHIDIGKATLNGLADEHLFLAGRLESTRAEVSRARRTLRNINVLKPLHTLLRCTLLVLPGLREQPTKRS
mmetsp:Transcript_9639/g.20961  ORF Transcript_9639/g.20961 Transcript_9639/m.20961 type:complete len:611 (-) Transcript_9639:300-2132(-)